ncbi:MAG: MotA/TolQ/ExbB proton channel family protein [Treponemataceae bacterium]|nr:MotA/TolQ/ExbB proton channel family protein [Treponemataceae bacterium]
MKLIELINLGGIVNWILFAVMIIACVLCLERLIYFLQTSRKTKKCPVKRMESVLLENSSLTQAEKKKLCVKESALIYGEMNMSLWCLNFISAVAPSLGLLGTVTGLISAFKGLSTGGNNIEISALSGGIWEAMLTTAFGMVISIPVLFCYRTFKRIIEKRVMKMELFIEENFSDSEE